MGSDFAKLGELERYFRKEKKMEGGKTHNVHKSCSFVAMFMSARPLSFQLDPGLDY
jgi:hypothetical protein